MKEHPILFSTEMVKAILAGTKTQTRRVIKPQPELIHDLWAYVRTSKYGPHVTCTIEWEEHTSPPKELLTYCPYGQVGSRLWVRETWAVDKKWDNFKPRDTPEGESVYYPYGGDPEDDLPGPYWVGKIRPSIFMPRWASRITLEITEVRVERLNQMTEADVKAEGIPSFTLAKGVLADEPPDPRWKFIELWDFLNAKRGFGWDANPRVWVLSFKVV